MRIHGSQNTALAVEDSPIGAQAVKKPTCIVLPLQYTHSANQLHAADVIQASQTQAHSRSSQSRKKINTFVVHTIDSGTTCSVQKSPTKIPDKISKMLLTQAFYRHIIGVASEQKKCTEAKNEQKQTFEQKTPQETTVPRRRSFLCDIILPIFTNKNTRRFKRRELLLVELAGTAPASAGLSWLVVYRHSSFYCLGA